MNVVKGDTVLEGELLVVITPSVSRETVKQTISKTGKPKDSQISKPQTKIDGTIRAPIPGTVIDILVKEGDKVKTGDVVIILEAMKMESEIHTEKDGTVSNIKVNKGASVNEGDLLMMIGD
ncbi:MAG: biotin/lipoyl-binding protein [Candidatus Cloacimonetes bacterium]|nr:biotin/lipoyl-binding protein [Candidatus Cloacimonadota bacterium]